jgi:hypothetical protein
VTTLAEFASDSAEQGDTEGEPWCVENDAEEWCQRERDAGAPGCFDHFGGGA